MSFPAWRLTAQAEAQLLLFVFEVMIAFGAITSVIVVVWLRTRGLPFDPGGGSASDRADLADQDARLEQALKKAKEWCK